MYLVPILLAIVYSAIGLLTAAYVNQRDYFYYSRDPNKDAFIVYCTWPIMVVVIFMHNFKPLSAALSKKITFITRPIWKAATRITRTRGGSR